MLSSIYTRLFLTSLRLPGIPNSGSGLNFFLLPSIWLFLKKKKKGMEKEGGRRGGKEWKRKKLCHFGAYCHSPAWQLVYSLRLHPKTHNHPAGLQPVDGPSNILVFHFHGTIISQGSRFYVVTHPCSPTVHSVSRNCHTSTAYFWTFVSSSSRLCVRLLPPWLLFSLIGSPNQQTDLYTLSLL